MTSQQNQDFQFHLPNDDEDDEDNYADDGDMEDDDNIPIDNGESATDENEEPDSIEGSQPPPQQQQFGVDATGNLLAMQENAYQAAMQVQSHANPAHQFGKQIHNQMAQHPMGNQGGNRMRPQSAKTVPSVPPNAFGAAPGLGAYNN